jgi:hypothetical protein
MQKLTRVSEAQTSVVLQVSERGIMKLPFSYILLPLGEKGDQRPSWIFTRWPVSRLLK